MLKGLRILAVIPARYGSTRLPGKPLLQLAGVPVIVRTLQAVKRAQSVDQVVVATDDERISRVVTEAGGKAVMTSKDCANGTLRVVEACHRLGQPFDVAINVQGDEPLVSPRHVDKVASLVAGTGRAARRRPDVGTLAVRIRSKKELADPSVVKCVLNKYSEAMYFSRAPIPYDRDNTGSVENCSPYLRHLGIYAFSANFLTRKLQKMESTELEALEKLEQLRWLQHGARISVQIVSDASKGIDTWKDLAELQTVFDDRATDQTRALN
mmetsp:Transcript_6173/g.18642  ORF Transcript_6173/g.18642 Transcript_6173/m.18642 type:complete len:268 (-) Transcript_6173:1272-2075(-)